MKKSINLIATCSFLLCPLLAGAQAYSGPSPEEQAALNANANMSALDSFLDEANKKKKTLTARPAYASELKKAQDAILKDDLTKAKTHLDKLHSMDSPTKYEAVRINVLDYWYNGKLGNKAAENEAASKIMADGHGLIDADVYAEAGMRLFTRQYNSQDYGGAIDTLANLRKEPTALPQLASAGAAIQKIDEMSAPDKDIFSFIKTDAEGNWTAKLLRQTFYFDKISGAINTINLTCENKSLSINYKPDSVMSTQPEWGTCSIAIKSTPSTSFSFVQLVKKPTAQ